MKKKGLIYLMSAVLLCAVPTYVYAAENPAGIEGEGQPSGAEEQDGNGIPEDSPSEEAPADEAPSEETTPAPDVPEQEENIPDETAPDEAGPDEAPPED